MSPQSLCQRTVSLKLRIRQTDISLFYNINRFFVLTRREGLFVTTNPLFKVVIYGSDWATSISYRLDRFPLSGRSSFFWSNIAPHRSFVSDGGTVVFTSHYWLYSEANDCGCKDATSAFRRSSRTFPRWSPFARGISSPRTQEFSSGGSNRPRDASISGSRYRRRSASTASCLSRRQEVLGRGRDAWWGRPSSDPIPVRNRSNETRILLAIEIINKSSLR